MGPVLEKYRWVQTLIAYISLNIKEVTERVTDSESAYNSDWDRQKNRKFSHKYNWLVSQTRILVASVYGINILKDEQ